MRPNSAPSYTGCKLRIRQIVSISPRVTLEAEFVPLDLEPGGPLFWVGECLVANYTPYLMELFNGQWNIASIDSKWHSLFSCVIG